MGRHWWQGIGTASDDASRLQDVPDSAVVGSRTDPARMLPCSKARTGVWTPTAEASERMAGHSASGSGARSDIGHHGRGVAGPLNHRRAISCSPVVSVVDHTLVREV